MGLRQNLVCAFELACHPAWHPPRTHHTALHLDQLGEHVHVVHDAGQLRLVGAELGTVLFGPAGSRYHLLFQPSHPGLASGRH